MGHGKKAIGKLKGYFMVLFQSDLRQKQNKYMNLKNFLIKM